MNTRIIIFPYVLCGLLLMISFCSEAQDKKIIFDLSHGQCKDIYPGYEDYMYVIPEYQNIAQQLGAKLSVNDSLEITSKMLKDADLLIMLSPLSNKLQKNISESECEAIIRYVKKGGKLIIFIDDEHRVDIEKYGASKITEAFGIELGDDIKTISMNCGAISFINEIFSAKREIPYSGARFMKGGIPASVCMEGGYLHASYLKMKNGGKIFVAADTMVGLLMGYPDGERNSSNKMETRWWGKDSKIYMTELIKWAIN